MSSYKNIFVAVPFDETLAGAFSKLKELDFLKEAKVKLLHVFEARAVQLEFTTYYYPTKEETPAIQEGVLLFLDRLREKNLGKNTNVKTECKFALNPKNAFCEALQQEKADLAIVATRGLTGMKGLFSSSFADYMIKHAPCDVLVLRHK